MNEGRVVKVAGPLVVAENMHSARMYDVVHVSDQNLIGEIIELREDRASIQVYEETGGLGPGEPVRTTGEPLSVELGPGVLTSIFDGIQRPLDVIMQIAGTYITRGISVPSLDRKKKWAFKPIAQVGQQVTGGDFLGRVQETTLIEHRVMVPPNVAGKVIEIHEGEFTVEETVAVLEAEDGQKISLTMMQKWPVRKARPYKRRIAPEIPLVTGQRILDVFCPVAKGGTASVPGPFGAGKTVIQHQLAKWADAEVIIFIGCGERGNEMTDVLLEFPELKDPKSGEPLMLRTVLIANTSNMPVAAREASIYTGITIAEYFRDMGYSVALMGDSTSRWAEALREMSGRLEEMPGEEGYPAYLPSRLAEFYERAGRVYCLGSEERLGSLTAIGAVSPPGGDLSDPVVQATLKVVKVFWSLEARLAYERHFPAINWLTSYSLYHDQMEEFYLKEVSEEWTNLRKTAMRLLQEEDEIKEIARLVGMDSLSHRDRLILETARSLREDFLHQNAFHEIDTYCSLDKQCRMLRNILTLHWEAEKALERGVTIHDIVALHVREGISRMRYTGEEKRAELDRLQEEIIATVGRLKSSENAGN